MCGGGNKGSSGPSEAEIKAREAKAAADARAQVLAEQTALAKKTNDSNIAALKTQADAESAAQAQQQQVLDSVNLAEKKRNDDYIRGKSGAADSEASSYQKQQYLLSNAAYEEDNQNRRLRAQAAKRTLLGGS